ncbi:MAG: hypothetical protein ACFFC7_02055 [Candidatus Hermodarchaeota archaeon]
MQLPLEKPKQILSCLVVAENKPGYALLKHETKLRLLKHIFQNKGIDYEFTERKNLKIPKINKWDLVVTLGEDKTFLTASNLIQGKTSVLGIHTNPATETYFLATSALNLEQTINQILDGHLQPISLPRIKVKGKPFFSLADLYFGRNHGWRTSKYALLLENGTWEHQQSSGVIITTGLGSTGGYGSITGGDLFSPLSPELRFIIWAPYLVGRLTTTTKIKGKITKDKPLLLRNLVEKGIIFSYDSNIEVQVEFDEIVQIDLIPNSLDVYNPLFYQAFLQQ